MNKFYRNTLVLLATIATVFASAQDYSNGILILNEGLIGTGNSSISYLNTDDIIENNVFATQNSGLTLGDTGQGIALTEDKVFVVLNYSNELKIIDRTTFTFITSITDQMSSPRNVAVYENTAFVTNWGDPGVVDDDYVAIVDLATNTVTGTIAVAEGPEEILEKDGKLYVIHQGGYGFGNTVSVIDIATQTVSVITVGDVPSALKIDETTLYVLCSGNPNYSGNETSGKLLKIELDNTQNITEFDFPGVEHPAFLGLDDTAVYYTLNNDIYKMELTASTLPTTPFIDTSSENIQLAYGFNKIDDKIYIADGIDYVSDGKIFVYSEDGSFIQDYGVGPLPNGFYKYEEPTATVPEYALNTIALYPNPATDAFKLNTTEETAVQIYDLSGRLIVDTVYTNEAISLSGFKAGVYLVVLDVAGTKTTNRLIVK